MLPKDILRRIKNGEHMTGEHYEEVTILFCRICDFDNYSARLSPHEVVKLLNIVFSAFDNLVDKAHVHKVREMMRKLFPNSILRAKNETGNPFSLLSSPACFILIAIHICEPSTSSIPCQFKCANP